MIIEGSMLSEFRKDSSGSCSSFVPRPKDQQGFKLTVDTRNSNMKQVSVLFTIAIFKGVACLLRVHSKICDDVKQISGYISLKEKGDMFFWFFESRTKPKTDPMILYMSGGPGTSSMAALGSGVGPCLLNQNAIANPFSWNKRSNLLFIEQPLGTGFSTGFTPLNSKEAAVDIVDAITKLRDIVPMSGEVNLAGDSYAGHVIPWVGLGFLNTTWLSLSSIIIGSGWIDPQIQLATMYYRACHGNSPLSPKTQCRNMKDVLVDSKLSSCALDASPDCADLWDMILNTFLLKYHDMRDTRIPAQEPSYNRIQTFFKNETIRSILGIQPEISFSVESDIVYDTFYTSGDNLSSSFGAIERLLNSNMRVFLYCGRYDFMANCRGLRAISNSLHWPGQSAFLSKKPYYYGSPKTTAIFAQHKQLAFANFIRSGHEVYKYQPRALSRFIKRWVHHLSF